MIFLCNTTDISDDEMLRVELPDGHAVCVGRWEGAYYCTDDLCTHGEASLSDGFIEEGSVFCPFHMGAFCLKTGEATAAPCTISIKTYPLEVEDEKILIDYKT